MKKSLTYSLILLCLIFTASAQEKKRLYKWVDKNGNTHFTDEPVEGAQEIEMKEVPTTQMKPVSFPQIAPSQLETEGGKNNSAQSDTYQTLELVEPQNNGVVRNNGGAITFKAVVEPSLNPEHNIRFFIDGQLLKNPNNSLSVSVDQVEFGPHSANIVIVDKQGRQLQVSKNINFQLLHSINPKIRQQRRSSN